MNPALLVTYNHIVLILIQIAECTGLPEIMNGFITYAPDNEADYNIGTVATYRCNSGFTLVGDMTRDCVQVNVTTAAFNRQAPVCQRKNYNVKFYSPDICMFSLLQYAHLHCTI